MCVESNFFGVEDQRDERWTEVGSGAGEVAFRRKSGFDLHLSCQLFCAAAAPKKPQSVLAQTGASFHVELRVSW